MGARGGGGGEGGRWEGGKEAYTLLNIMLITGLSCCLQLISRPPLSALVGPNKFTRASIPLACGSIDWKWPPAALLNRKLHSVACKNERKTGVVRGVGAGSVGWGVTKRR